MRICSKFTASELWQLNLRFLNCNPESYNPQVCASIAMPLSGLGKLHNARMAMYSASSPCIVITDSSGQILGGI